MKTGCDGGRDEEHQTMSSQSMIFGQKNYFELKAFGNEHTQKEFSALS